MSTSLFLIMGLLLSLHYIMCRRLGLWTIHTSVAVTIAIVATVVALMN